jgi:hypothetical protein
MFPCMAIIISTSKKSVSRLLSAETRWRTCKEASAATAGPKRREALATGARHHKKSVSRSPSAETRWRACKEASAATAGPKRREALATGARHRKLGAGFYTFLNLLKNKRTFYKSVFYASTLTSAPIMSAIVVETMIPITIENI